MEYSRITTLQLTGPNFYIHGPWRVHISGVLCAHVETLKEAMEGATPKVVDSLELKACDPESCQDFRVCKTTSLAWEFLTGRTEPNAVNLPISGYFNNLQQTLAKLGYKLKTHSMYSNKHHRNSTWTFQIDDFIQSA